MSTIEITSLDGLKFELQDEARKGARIKVIGIGGAGANAVARMLQEGLEGVEFHVLNTDLQSLGEFQCAKQDPDRGKTNERARRRV